MQKKLLLTRKFHKKVCWNSFVGLQLQFVLGSWIFHLEAFDFMRCSCQLFVLYFPLIFLKISCFFSIGLLLYDSSMTDFENLASMTTFKDSLFANTITGFIRVFQFGWKTVIIGKIILFFLCMSISPNFIIWVQGNLTCALIFWKLRLVLVEDLNEKPIREF